jgi:hypothetical protein
MTLKAFQVVWRDMPNVRTYIAAEHRGEAVTRVFQHCKEAYDDAEYVEFNAKRAPEFDELATRIDATDQLYTSRQLGWEDLGDGSSMGCAGSPADDGHISHPTYQFINDFAKHNRITLLQRELDKLQAIS